MIRNVLLRGAACVALGLLVPGAAYAAPPASPLVERNGADSLLVTWKSPVPVDVYVADRAGTDIRHARLVSPRDADGSATFTAPNASRSYVILRNVRTGEIARAAERLIPLETGSNFRDIGGYPAAGGRHVKWGAIYRSGGTPLLNEPDRARVRALGLVNMIDLRSDEERVLAPTRIDGVPYTAVGYSMAGLSPGGGIDATYRNLPAMMAPQLRQIFAKLLRRETPLAYNCSAGQDRTGFATAIVLSALGTGYDTILADYHLSTRYRRPEFEMPRFDPALYPGNAAAELFGKYQSDPRYLKPQPLMTAAGKPFLDFAFAQMNEKWGGVTGYLHQELKLSDADLRMLRTLYTE